MKGKILVAIPAFNEAGSIGSVIDGILALPLSGQFDVLIINDGSTDATEKICRAKGVMVINHIYNLGYGAALKTAYKYAAERDYQYIIQMDADGQHDVCNIERVYNRLSAQDDDPPDIVIGSRFLEKNVLYRNPVHKRLVVAVINVLIRTMTRQKITDPTSGLQGLSRRAFDYYAGFNRFATDYPDANMVIQMIMNGFLVEEIPAVMHPRETGVSMHQGIYKPIKYIIKMLLSIMAVFLREMFNTQRREAAGYETADEQADLTAERALAAVGAASDVNKGSGN